MVFSKEEFLIFLICTHICIYMYYPIISSTVQMDSKSRNTQNRSIGRQMSEHFSLLKKYYLLTLTNVCLNVPSFCSTRTRPATLKSLSNQECLRKNWLDYFVIASIDIVTRYHHHKVEHLLQGNRTFLSWI